MSQINLQLETDIDVISKYEVLVKNALDGDSIYIRAKETLEELFDEGSIKSTDNAKIIAETIAGMSNSLSANAMSTALQWASQEKDLFMKKAELEYRLDILDKESAKASVDLDIGKANKIAAQSENLRKYGTPVLDAKGDVASLPNEGISYEQLQGLIQDNKNKALLEPQVKAQTEEVYARTHKVVADTYVNHGLFTNYSLTDKGIASADKVVTNFVTLSDLNKEVAREQAKGYTLNAWANAATSSASMVGTLVAAEIPGLDPTQYLTSWKTPTDKLAGLTLPTITI